MGFGRVGEGLWIEDGGGWTVSCGYQMGESSGKGEAITDYRLQVTG